MKAVLGVNPWESFLPGLPKDVAGKPLPLMRAIEKDYNSRLGMLLIHMTPGILSAIHAAAGGDRLALDDDSFLAKEQQKRLADAFTHDPHFRGVLSNAILLTAQTDVRAHWEYLPQAHLPEGTWPIREDGGFDRDRLTELEAQLRPGPRSYASTPVREILETDGLREQAMLDAAAFKAMGTRKLTQLGEYLHTMLATAHADRDGVARPDRFDITDPAASLLADWPDIQSQVKALEETSRAAQRTMAQIHRRMMEGEALQDIFPGQSPEEIADACGSLYSAALHSILPPQGIEEAIYRVPEREGLGIRSHMF